MQPPARCSNHRCVYIDQCGVGHLVTESTEKRSLDDVKTHHTHTFSSTKLLTRVSVADKLVLVNPFWWNNHFICSLFNALFSLCFKLICTARVIDCKHRSQWRHQQILHSTAPYGRGIWEKESIIGVQWFQKNPNPRVPRSVGNSASLVSHWNGGPSGWDFSVPTEHQLWILFVPHRFPCEISLTYTR